MNRLEFAVFVDRHDHLLACTVAGETVDMTLHLPLRESVTGWAVLNHRACRGTGRAGLAGRPDTVLPRNVNVAVEPRDVIGLRQGGRAARENADRQPRVPGGCGGRGCGDGQSDSGSCSDHDAATNDRVCHIDLLLWRDAPPQRDHCAQPMINFG